MNPILRDGFVTMVSAFVATVFYGAPLVAVGLGTGGWSPPPEIAESRVRMLIVEDGTLDDAPAPTDAVPEPELVPPDADEIPAGPEVARGEDPGPAAEEGAAEAEADVGQAAGEGATGDGTDGKTVRPAAGSGGKGRSRRQKVCDNPHPNVHAREGFVDIDRSLVEKYTKNLDSFMSLGYSRPYDENGIRGWYIGGFGCSSPVHKAGFRRGDVLLSVNGKNTRSWIGVFMLYQKLKHKNDFDIRIVRKGAPVTLKFRIVPG